MNRQETGMHTVYKKRGETPLECLQRIRQEFHIENTVPMTYAGRLDPMAEGVLLMLKGETTKQKDEFLDLPKTYLFTILWGVATDTYDILGKVTETSQAEAPSVADVVTYLQKNVGVSDQIYPPYSSKPVMGKPLFQWAREGRLGEINIPSHSVEIFSAQHIDRQHVRGGDVSEDIWNGINSVHGDFRQKEITDCWSNYFNESTGEYVLDTIQVTASSGFYVRQFVHDLGKAFHIPTTTYRIIRTAIGTHTVEK